MAKEQPRDVSKPEMIMNGSPPDVKHSKPTVDVNRNLSVLGSGPPDVVTSHIATHHKTPDTVAQTSDSPVLIGGVLHQSFSPPVSTTYTSESPALVSAVSGQSYQTKPSTPLISPVGPLQPDSASTPTHKAQPNVVVVQPNLRTVQDSGMAVGVQPSTIPVSHLMIRSPPHVVRAATLATTNLHPRAVATGRTDFHSTSPVTPRPNQVVIVRQDKSPILLRKPVPKQSPLVKPTVSPPRGYVVVAKPLTPASNLTRGPIQQMIGFSAPETAAPQVPKTSLPPLPQLPKGFSSEGISPVIQSQPHFVSEGLVPIPVPHASQPSHSNVVARVDVVPQQKPPASSPVHSEVGVVKIIPKPISAMHQQPTPAAPKLGPHKPVNILPTTQEPKKSQTQMDMTDLIVPTPIDDLTNTSLAQIDMLGLQNQTAIANGRKQVLTVQTSQVVMSGESVVPSTITTPLENSKVSASGKL